MGWSRLAWATPAHLDDRTRPAGQPCDLHARNYQFSAAPMLPITVART
jgi:hypothetical protein